MSDHPTLRESAVSALASVRERPGAIEMTAAELAVETVAQWFSEHAKRVRVRDSVPAKILRVDELLSEVASADCGAIEELGLSQISREANYAFAVWVLPDFAHEAE